MGRLEEAAAKSRVRLGLQEQGKKIRENPEAAGANLVGELIETVHFYGHQLYDDSRSAEMGLAQLGRISDELENDPEKQLEGINIVNSLLTPLNEVQVGSIEEAQDMSYEELETAVSGMIPSRIKSPVLDDGSEAYSMGFYPVDGGMILDKQRGSDCLWINPEDEPAYCHISGADIWEEDRKFSLQGLPNGPVETVEMPYCPEHEGSKQY